MISTNILLPYTFNLYYYYNYIIIFINFFVHIINIAIKIHIYRILNIIITISILYNIIL